MNQHIWGDETLLFSELSPDLILSSVEALGLQTTGRVLTLNSMENRVFEIEIYDDTDPFVVAKFYRPGRWSWNQIKQEHQFLLDLVAEELPVIAPLQFNGETLFTTSDNKLFYTIFPRKAGRIPDELTVEQLEILGRMVARMHNIGASKEAPDRLQLTTDIFGLKNLNSLLKDNLIAPQLEERFSTLVEQLCEVVDPMLASVPVHRIHGDLHRSNVIARDEKLFLIDFDDMLMGPAVQDVWLLIPGDDQQALIDRDIFLEEYETFRTFDHTTLNLIEPLRALRFIHFAAWIGKRWKDEAFKRAFPYYGSDEYWSHLTYDLHLQLEKISNGNSVGNY